MDMNLTPEFVAALLAARGQMPELSKNATANMGRYSYVFASLPHIIKTIEPALRANGIALSLPMDGDLQGCVLMHGSGGYIASWDRFTEYMDTEAERRWKRENNQAGAVSDIDKERVGATTSARRVLIAGIVGMTATDDAGRITAERRFKCAKRRIAKQFGRTIAPPQLSARQQRDEGAIACAI